MSALPLSPACVRLGVQVQNRAAAIHLCIELLAASGALRSPEDGAILERLVMEREALASTDVGRGAAVPHAKSDVVRYPAMAAVRLDPPLPLDPGSQDEEPLRLLFLAVCPDGEDNTHVLTLGALATALLNDKAYTSLLAAETPEAFVQALHCGEQRLPEPEREPPSYRVLAVTACPTGIAHTFMAKEALQGQAERMGVSLKVETHGADGVQNALTQTEIEKAECIIVAADRTVNTERFVGKPLIRVPVSKAIRDPEQLLHRALSATAPDFKQPMPDLFTAGAPLSARLRGLAHRIYGHVMSGISHMLPFVTGGGILIALSYLLHGGAPLVEQTVQQPDLAGLLYSVGQACFAMMYVVLAGFIAVSIGDTAAFLPGAVGGYMAYVGMSSAPLSEWVSSGFCGALAAGFAAGLLLKGFAWLGRHLPRSIEQVKTTLFYPTAGLFCMALLMIYVVNPPLGRFNDFILLLLTDLRGGSRLVLCAVLGGLMAIDYGGPVNKAAYVFGTMALMNGQPDLMASVMIGGMTPPLGIAVACLLFPHHFTPAGRRTAPSNFVLGASFVTEGALPFAIRDPLRVIPSCVVGSAVAGTLSEWLGCTVPAPHGGVFLLPVMGQPLGFLAALAAGSLTTTLLLGLLKKPVDQDNRNDTSLQRKEFVAPDAKKESRERSAEKIRSSNSRVPMTRIGTLQSGKVSAER